MNGIRQQLAKCSPAMGQIKNMIGMIRAAQNPQAMIQQMMNSNPNMKQVMQIVNQYGGDANRAFQETARQNGINPEEIFDMIK